MRDHIRSHESIKSDTLSKDITISEGTLPVHLNGDLVFSVYCTKTRTLGYHRFDSSPQTLLHVSLCPSCLSLSPMMSSMKAAMPQNSLSLSPQKISSVYLLHVNPASLSFICRLWFMYFYKEKKMATQRSQIGVTALCFIHCWCTVAFSLISPLFSESIFESSQCQSILSPSPSAGLVVGGWLDVPQGAGVLSGLQACLRATLTRQSHQTASSGYCATPNTHQTLPFARAVVWDWDFSVCCLSWTSVVKQTLSAWA